MKMNRHDFLKTVAATGLVTTLETGSLTSAFGKSSKGGACDLVAVMGGEPDELITKAIETIGPMSRFVKKGAKVVIKPNIGWDKAPELAGNTNPVLIATLVKLCFDAGAASVQVFDNTCDAWRRCYTSSGIEKAAQEAGADVIPGNDEKYYTEIELPKAKVLKTAKIHTSLLECDVWFNVPILKTHGGAKMTIAMKNHMGIVWDRRFFHQNGLQQCIADICTLAKPAALHIVDAYRVMKSNGPRGKSLADVVNPKALFASTDIVAVDTAATMFFNQIEKMPLSDVSHIGNGEDLGLGTTNISKLNVKRVRI